MLRFSSGLVRCIASPMHVHVHASIAANPGVSAHACVRTCVLRVRACMRRGFACTLVSVRESDAYLPRISFESRSCPLLHPERASPHEVDDPAGRLGVTRRSRM